ncbi:LLM class flavin-dependent oxidoreductase [Microbispora sp. NPDC049125]|uniref:LLM class flavin-dependent oxidoreductase n=1 Tax=Microbispora sp. NPDC049125 TaxID=3154929 RepID=UPI0034665C79
MSEAEYEGVPAGGGRPGPSRVGLLLPTREMAILGSYSMAPLLELARRAETLGFDSLWTGDSLLARPRLDPLVVLAAAAAVTERITLGTAALIGPLRHPLTTASALSALDHAAGGGRLTLGVGSGFPIPDSEEEFAAVGVPFTGRAGRLDEIACLWKRAWNSGRPDAYTSFAGKLWQQTGLDRLAPPATPGGPPLWLAGSDTPKVLARVAELYDGWMPFLPDSATYARAWLRIRELAGQWGRPDDAITPALYATINVNPDRDKARQELDEYVQGYYGRPLELMSTIQAYGYGSAEECADWLGGYIEAGARHIVVRIGSLDPGPQLDEIAGELLPAVRRIG